MALAARLVIRPAVPQSTQPSGFARLTWLKKLKASARNCPFSLSVSAKFLKNDASVVNQRGPSSVLRPAFPIVPIAGRLQGPLVSPLFARVLAAPWYQ